MLKKFYSTQEEVPEAVRQLYIEQDGRFVLNVEGGFEDVSKLKSALTSERALREGFEKEAKAWKNCGLDSPDKASELLKKVESMSKLDPKTEAERIAQEKINLIRQQLADQAGAENKGLKAENESLTGQLQKLLVDNTAQKVLAEHEGDATLLLPHIRDRIKMVKNSQGTYVTQVLDEAGNPRVNADARDMTVADLVVEMKQDKSFSRAFNGSGASGSGAQGAGAGTGTAANPTVLKTDDPFVLGEHAEGIANGTIVVESP